MENNKKAEWSRESSSLIEEYERYPCLYDPKHKFDPNKHARNEALLNITKEVQKIDETLQLEDIKKKITSLRQQFSHERTKMKEVIHSGMGSDEIYEPSVWWYDKLLFLVPFIKTRKSKSSLDSVLETESQYEILETESDVSGDSTVSHKQNAINSVKKRKVQEEKLGTDPVIDQALTTLKKLENKLNSDVQSHLQIFGEYVSSELQTINNDELIDDAKHEISEIIYKTKKKWLALKKTRANY